MQASLLALTATTVADALRAQAARTQALYVCGGGALNGALMRALAAATPAVTVASTAEAGLAPMQVEAAAFAWLAHAHLQRQSGNLPAVTGAHGPRVLGALYPAR